jgi:type II secretory pathway component GspD/PulD (secretin)
MFDPRNSGVDFRSMSEEERTQYFDKQRVEGENRLKAILKPEQYSRLQQISWHRSGPSALGRDESLVAEFKITPEQKAQFEKLRDDERSNGRNYFQMSDEDRAKARTESEAKYMAVLTPAQQQQWKDKIGPIPKEIEGGSRPGFSIQGGPPGAAPAATPRYIRTDRPVEGPVVMSFAPGDKAAAGAPQATDNTFSFSFNGAPWDLVLDMFAKKAGLTLDLHDIPPGTFTYFDSNKYTPTQALDVINRYLADRGYILIRRDNALVSYNLENPISPNLIPNVTVDQLKNHGEHELMRLVLPITVGNVEQIARDIEAVKGPQGEVKSMVSTNTIVVTDLGTNLRRVAEMVKDVVPMAENNLVFHAYPLNYIAAEDAETYIRTQLGVAQSVPNVMSSGRSFGGFGGFGGGPPGFGGFDRGRDGGSRDPNAAARTATVTPTPGATVQADTRLNNLFVTATPAQHRIVEEVLKVLDVDDGSGKRLATGSNKKYLDVYQLKSADVRDVGRSLEAIMGPGVVVNSDNDTDRLHIMGTPKQHEEVRRQIALMDGIGSQEVAVIPLAKMDPTQAMSSLRAVFVRDTTPPTIEPDTYGRQLIVRATADQMIQIRKVLEGLGEDGTGRRAAQTGTLRAFNTQGRDAEALLQMTQRMMGGEAKQRIRIVTPENRSGGAVNGIRVPSQRNQPEPTSSEAEQPISTPPRKASAPGGRADYQGRPGGNVARMLALLEAEESQTLSAVSAEAEPAGNAQAEEKEKEAAAAKPSKPGITATIIDDQIVLQSDDEKALDQLEDFLQQSLEYVPPSNKPTIFVLQSSDPVETANALVALFPDLSLNAAATSSSSGGMSSLFSGVSNFGSDLWSASGMSSMSNNRFQVIPNTRLNALFVYGPPHKVAEVEQMIEILDATDWPENARSRRPRMIELKYADVNEVYQIVKDVYADFLESESSRNAQNPLAALAGGGRGGQREATPPRMTLGIDHNSSKLIVSANDETFSQVMNLVETLDQAALDSQRTVRVVQIKNADAATLQNALQQIVPKVQPAQTSGGRSSGGSPPSGGSSGGDRGSSSGGDDARRQQMMQMFGGGAPGASPFGGGGGSPFGGRSGFSPFGGGGSRGGFSPWSGGSRSGRGR